MVMRGLIPLSGSLMATALAAAALCGASGAAASTHSFLFESEPLICVPFSLSCENPVPLDLEEYADGTGTTLKPLRARLVVDEALLPLGTIKNAKIAWYSELLNPGIYLDPLPDWLVAFSTNYGGFADADFAANISFTTDAAGRIVDLDIFRWTVGGVPHEFTLSLREAGVSYACEDETECFEYAGSLASITALIPAPATLLPFLISLGMFGGHAFLRRGRSVSA